MIVSIVVTLLLSLCFCVHALWSHVLLQLGAELKQVQTKLVQVEQCIHTQTAECERQQQKIRELELELARTSTNRSATTSLQEDLQAERARLIAADKKVSAGTIPQGSALSSNLVKTVALVLLN